MTFGQVVNSLKGKIATAKCGRVWHYGAEIPESLPEVSMLHLEQGANAHLFVAGPFCQFSPVWSIASANFPPSDPLQGRRRRSSNFHRYFLISCARGGFISSWLSARPPFAWLPSDILAWALGHQMLAYPVYLLSTLLTPILNQSPLKLSRFIFQH